MNHLRHTCFIVATFMLGLPSPLSAAELPGYEQQIQQLRRIRGRMLMAATGTMLPSGVWEPLTRRTETQAAELVSRPGGWWSPYDTVDHPAVSFNGAAWHDAAILARAWAMPRSRFHHSEEVMKAIREGLTHLQQFAYPDCPKPNNWWAWEIGMPMHVIETLLLCGQELDAPLRQKLIETLAYVLDVREDVKLTGPASLPLPDNPGKTDMNALWRMRLRFQLAVLIENPAMAGKWAAQAMSEIGRPGEGHLQADYSYQFHGPVPMWAYGSGFLAEYANLLEITYGSAFGPGREQVERFAQMVLHYTNGFLYRGSICPAMIGRELTRGDALFHDVYGPAAIHALAALVRSGHPRAKEMAALIARERVFFTGPKVRERVEQLTAGVPRVPPAPPVDDLLAYPDSDFLQVTRPNWAVGIKMHSSRHAGYESINGENLQGWFLSHGTMFHFLTGREWSGCWPTLDWTRLPGATICRDLKDQSSSPIAGVLRVSPERALAAMELKAGDFRARKSWLVERDAIVCLGSGVAGPGRVETTVFNQPVAAGAVVLVDGEPAPAEAFEREARPRWIWLERMGYVFVPGTRVKLLREERTSDWTSVREARRHGAGETRSQWYLTGVIPHDADQRGYAYIVVPDVPAERMPDLAAAVLKPYAITAEGPHRITAADQTWEALVFWEPASAGSVKADGACLLLRDGGTWHAVDPSWSTAPRRISVGDQSFELALRSGRPAVLPTASQPSAQ